MFRLQALAAAPRRFVVTLRVLVLASLVAAVAVASTSPRETSAEPAEKGWPDGAALDVQLGPPSVPCLPSGCPPPPPPPPPCPGSSCTDGMSLDAPETVAVGETFTLSINADPPPSFDVAGFQTEVYFPAETEAGPECANSIDDDGDGVVNDGCAQVGGPEQGAQCANDIDDDGDGFVNDGCGEVLGAEEGAECENSTDDDEDGFVNDGCPEDGPAEQDAECANDTDDDGDGLVNDGCGPVGRSEEDTECANSTDDDGDGSVNDGCPQVGGPEAGSECGNGTDDDEDGFVDDGCPGASVLRWVQRAECAGPSPAGEVQAAVAGNPPLICARASGWFGQARHAVASAFQQPPLPALDAPLAALVELDVKCLQPGTYDVFATGVNQSVPESAYGATYFDLLAVPYFVGAKGWTEIDLDGDTVPETVPVVDRLVITCTEAPPPSNTPTATPTATQGPPDAAMPTAGPTAAATDGPHPTPTATLSLVGAATGTPTPSSGVAGVVAPNTGAGGAAATPPGLLVWGLLAAALGLGGVALARWGPLRRYRWRENDV